MRSYSPTINKEIERLSISPHDELFSIACNENEILVPEKEKCYSWKSKIAQKYLLDNLKSKKPLMQNKYVRLIKIDQIVGLILFHAFLYY